MHIRFQYFYELHCDAATTLYAMALQPTKRGLPGIKGSVWLHVSFLERGGRVVQGSWCREDRKKSYKPGRNLLFMLSDQFPVSGREPLDKCRLLSLQVTSVCWCSGSAMTQVKYFCVPLCTVV